MHCPRLPAIVRPARAALIASVALAGCALPDAGERYGTSTLAGAADSTPATTPFTQEPLATGWGETQASRVTVTSFRRAGTPAESAVHYGRLEEASRLGVIGTPRRKAMTLCGGRIEVEIEDARGRAFPVGSSPHGPVVFGRDGEPYRIRIENRTRRRLEVVVSVDGLDVVDGTAASSRKRGYVLNPRQEMLLRGWRRSSHAVAGFVFGIATDSYAARRHGDTRNVGVFGFAAFEEQAPPPLDDRPFATPPPPLRNPDPFPADG